MGKYDDLLAGRTNQNDKVVDKSTPSPVKPTKHRNTDSTLSVHQSISTSAFAEVATDDTVSAIHKSMRDSGSTLGSYRVSPMEKKRLEVTVFELKNRSIASADAQDFRTNENDVIRIAINYVLNDYKVSGEESILVKTLLSLRS